MAYVEGEARGQHTLFPMTLDELIPEDHVCRVIEAFVNRLDMGGLGFVRAEPAETGRPGDEQDEVVIEPSAVAAALEKLKSHPEPEARFMRTSSGHAPAYNVQTAVDAEHALIVAQVTTEANDQRSLLPMAEAAKQAVGAP